MTQKKCCDFVKVPLLLMTTCNIVNFAGFLTPGWAKANYGKHWVDNEDWRPPHREGPSMGVGLWYICTGGEDGSCGGWDMVSSALDAARAFSTLGTILLLLANIFLFLYYFGGHLKETTKMVLAVCFCVACSAAFILICAACFGRALSDYQAELVKQHRDLDLNLDYSFAMSVSAAVLAVMCNVFVFMEHTRLSGHAKY